MATQTNSNRRSFRHLERNLTLVILADLILFVLTLAASGTGILWLKIIVGLVCMAIAFLGAAFLVLINEHKRRRSWWMVVSFGALFLCTLVSLLTGSPAPGV